MNTTIFCRKQALLLTVTLTIFRLTAFSQEQQTSIETSRTPKFGIKGGINLGNLYVAHAESEHKRLGGNIGFYAKLPLIKSLSLQPELLYSTKGAKVGYDNVAKGTGVYHVNLNYIEVPLLLVLNLTTNMNISAGGYFSYLNSASARTTKKDGTIMGLSDLKANDFTRYDYGLAAGAGIDVENYTIGARLSYGMQSVGKEGNLSEELIRISRNMAASFFVGLAF